MSSCSTAGTAAAAAAATPAGALILATDLNFQEQRKALITMRAGVTSPADLANTIHEVAKKVQLHSTKADPNALRLYDFLDGFLEGVRPNLAVSEGETLRKIDVCLKAAMANFGNHAGEADRKVLANKAQNANAAAAAVQEPSAAAPSPASAPLPTTAKAETEAERKSFGEVEIAVCTGVVTPSATGFEYGPRMGGRRGLVSGADSKLMKALQNEPNGSYVVYKDNRSGYSHLRTMHRIFFVFNKQIGELSIEIFDRPGDPKDKYGKRGLRSSVSSYKQVLKGEVIDSGVKSEHPTFEDFIQKRTDLKFRLNADMYIDGKS